MTRPDSPVIRSLAVPLVVAAIVVVLAAWPGAFEALAWDRRAIAEGQWWRALTGQFVHLGPAHAVLNLAGLAAAGALFGREFRAADWAGTLALSLAGVAVGLQWFSPSVQWYVGLSGALHGVFAAGALAWVRAGRAGGWLLAVALGAKLVFEAVVGPSALSEWLTGGPVLVVAHVWGAAGGVVWGLAGRRPGGRL